jgi:hypothetical protein
LILQTKYSIGGRSDQYEKQKELLLSVLPKPKILRILLLVQITSLYINSIMVKMKKTTYNYATKDNDKSIEDFSC